MCRDFLLKWVLPKDKKQLNDWLYLLELGSIVVSVVFIAFFIAGLLADNAFALIRFAFIALFSFLALSVTIILQYLLAIEFNSRKR
ncbi:MAG: hypothetical protein V1834_03840 [Candidatus Micrarchaeota archaeon]